MNLWSETIAPLVKQFLDALFVDIYGLPLIVLWVILGAVFCTLRMRFINLRYLPLAVQLLRRPPVFEHAVTSWQALTTALSATVGLGNIAGVAIAISLGGPGASLWMTVAGLLSMNTRFIECTLGQQYRQQDEAGQVLGGPMYYLSAGLNKQGRPRLGQWLAGIFALFCIISTFGSSGMFQTGQSYAAIAQVWPELPRWLYATGMVSLTALITLGGIRRIGKVTERLIPVMCAGYLLMVLYIVLSHVTLIPSVIQSMVSDAFSPRAGVGGFLGLMAQGFRRATFSNEGGLGTAAIAHAAVETESAVEEGMVSSWEPFIDTVLICNLTAIAILVTGAEYRPEFAEIGGAELTSYAFGTVVSWFPIVLAIATVCFAFSTILSWGYYGEQAWVFLLGTRSRWIYKALQLSILFAGVFISPALVVEFSDAALFLMTIPNFLGLYFLSGQVQRDLAAYLARSITPLSVAIGWARFRDNLKIPIQVIAARMSVERD